jgi:hypothetical protein
MPFHGRKFHSHKFKTGSGLRYEVVLCIRSGHLVWINGPYEPGIWNDITIFRNALISELDEGERVEADDGYRGESPAIVKCPASITSDETAEAMQSHVRRRQETINIRFKQWNILRHTCRNDMTQHAGNVFRVAAIVAELAIDNGEPLFQVGYEDPYLDDAYYNEDEDVGNNAAAGNNNNNENANMDFNDL